MATQWFLWFFNCDMVLESLYYELAMYIMYTLAAMLRYVYSCHLTITDSSSSEEEQSASSSSSSSEEEKVKSKRKRDKKKRKT